LSIPDEPHEALTEPDAEPETSATSVVIVESRPETAWSEIHVLFVDDPHASVERAADLVDVAIREMLESVEARQSALRASWQAGQPGTEELRVGLQSYRAFWTALEACQRQASA
jgi:hypothetical protein